MYIIDAYNEKLDAYMANVKSTVQQLEEILALLKVAEILDVALEHIDSDAITESENSPFSVETSDVDISVCIRKIMSDSDLCEIDLQKVEEGMIICSCLPTLGLIHIGGVNPGEHWEVFGDVRDSVLLIQAVLRNIRALAVHVCLPA